MIRRQLCRIPEWRPNGDTNLKPAHLKRHEVTTEQCEIDTTPCILQLLWQPHPTYIGYISFKNKNTIILINEIYFLVTRTSIRRFMALPSSVELSAKGNSCPYPSALMRVKAIPVATSWLITYLALLELSFKFAIPSP